MYAIIFVLFLLTASSGMAEVRSDSLSATESVSLSLNGQLAGWSAIQFSNPALWLTGGRFVPTLTGRKEINSGRGWDGEMSLNINGSAIWSRDSAPDYNGQFKPYRVWLRYYTPDFEIRAGLQKINFGAAKMLRPLMWFDGMDIRDPLQLTDGVYGLLGKYYFQNNAGIWTWILAGNHRPKGYEWAGTAIWSPELGGRVQLPLGPGELALSYNHRMVNPLHTLSGWSDNESPPIPTESLSEHKVGFDGKWDLGIGLWIEGSLTALEEVPGSVLPSRTDLLNLGMDYTFAFGNGLGISLEYFRYHAGEKFITDGNSAEILASMVTYPLSLIDNMSLMIFYVPSPGRSYWMNYLTWSRTYDQLSVYLIGFINPETYNLPMMTTQGRNIFAGKGLQLMLSYNF